MGKVARVTSGAIPLREILAENGLEILRLGRFFLFAFMAKGTAFSLAAKSILPVSAGNLLCIHLGYFLRLRLGHGHLLVGACGFTPFFRRLLNFHLDLRRFDLHQLFLTMSKVALGTRLAIACLPVLAEHCLVSVPEFIFTMRKGAVGTSGAGALLKVIAKHCLPRASLHRTQFMCTMSELTVAALGAGAVEPMHANSRLAVRLVFLFPWGPRSMDALFASLPRVAATSRTVPATIGV